jgi:hypothetical protein
MFKVEHEVVAVDRSAVMTVQALGPAHARYLSEQRLGALATLGAVNEYGVPDRLQAIQTGDPPC